MKIAYLVFAYKNSRHLRREIEMLSSSDCAFFIHIDKKSNIEEFSEIRGSNIFYVDERIAVYWAEFTGVSAILLLIRQALSAPQHYDYLMLLSGSEYPIRSREYIHAFLEENRGMEFISMVKVPGPGKPISRINTIRMPSTKPVLRFFVRVLAKLKLARRDYRDYLGNLEPYSGITWWTLSREACQYVLDFEKRSPQMSTYFEYTFAPEETFIHTILGNSTFKTRVRRNLLYEDWSAEGAHPEMIGDRHIAMFEAQEKICISDANGCGEVLFARKFSDSSLHLLHRIDSIAARKEER